MRGLTSEPERSDSASRLFCPEPGDNPAGFKPSFLLMGIVVGDTQERVEGSKRHWLDEWRNARTFQSLSGTAEADDVDIFFFNSRQGFSGNSNILKNVGITLQKMLRRAGFRAWN
ncbi:MAG: hypothetical protein NTV93_20895 [Verrucomicrobia bacterium]|nr:hypothetical protein [Verrucomicrobiota bacterium]